jgi:uncharacterized protein (TIGR02270 family)
MLWDIYEQHLEEAAFQWTRWEQALVAPDYVLDELEQLEERLHAHVDGLVLGGEPIAKRLLHPALEEDDIELLRAAAFALLLGEFPGGSNAVLDRARSADDAALTAIQRAMEALETTRLPPWLQPLLREDNPALQALGLEVMSHHHRAPAAACRALATHDSPKVTAAALRAAARSQVELAPALLERALTSPAVEVRDAAIVAGGLGGHRSVWEACRAAVQSRTPRSTLPLVLLAISGDERDLARLQELLSEEALRPDVLWALGFTGRVACADTCFEFMRQKPVAALAAEAFSAITGLRIEESYAAEREMPEEQEPVPLAQEDLDADLSLKPEDALPLPQVEAIAQWWQEARPRLEARRRYLEGQPFSPQVLVEALAQTSMRRRHILALELALRSRGAYQVPTRAVLERQVKVMRIVQGLPAYALHKALNAEIS